MSADTTPTNPWDDGTDGTDGTDMTDTALAPIGEAATSPSAPPVEDHAEYAPPLPDEDAVRPVPVAATAAVSSAVGPASASTAPAELATPRTRGAAIVWGLLFAAIASFGMWMLTDDDRRAGAAGWMTSLTPNTVYSLVLLTIGVLVLVTGAVGLIRHAQRRTAAQR